MERISFVSYKGMWLSDSHIVSPDPVGTLLLISPTTVFAVLVGQYTDQPSGYRIVRFERETVLQILPVAVDTVEIHLSDGGVISIKGVASADPATVAAVTSAANASSGQLSKLVHSKLGFIHNKGLSKSGYLEVRVDYNNPSLGETDTVVLALEFGYRGRKIYMPKYDGIISAPRISCALMGSVFRRDTNDDSGSVVAWYPVHLYYEPARNFGGYFTNNDLMESLMTQDLSTTPGKVSGITCKPQNGEYPVFAKLASGADITFPRGDIPHNYQGELRYAVSSRGRFISSPDLQSTEASGEVGFDRFIVIYNLIRSDQCYTVPSLLQFYFSVNLQMELTLLDDSRHSGCRSNPGNLELLSSHVLRSGKLMRQQSAFPDFSHLLVNWD